VAARKTPSEDTRGQHLQRNKAAIRWL
jgi:hypothetical protein